MSTEHISAGVDIENFSSRDAMILINGKPEVGTVAFPQSGSCINEEQMLDESFTDQICGIFKYLNNIILVTNQHGTLLNQILKREREEERPNEILRELEGLGHLGELSNQKLEAIMSSARENKANEAYEGKAGNSIKALKGTLHGLYYANDSLFQSNEAVLTKTEEMLKRLRLLEEKKASIDQVEQIKNETLTRCEKDIGNTSNDITEKISLLDKEIDRKINESMARMGEIEKETVWKIKDCEELLKARATEKYVSGIFELAEKNTQLKMEDIERKISEMQTMVSDTSKVAGDDRLTSIPWDSINEKFVEFENKFGDRDAQSVQTLPGDLGEKFENCQMKFSDIESMISSNQKRIEDIYNKVKGLELSSVKFSTFEEEAISKFAMIMSTLTELGHDIDSCGTRPNDDSGSGGKQKAKPQVEKKPVVEQVQERKRTADIEQPDDQPTGTGMTTQERNLLRRCQDELDDMRRKEKNFEDNFTKIDSKLNGLNQIISVIQTDLGYKLDKEQFENALDYKLDKEEYYQKKNEASLNIDTLKKLEHLMGKLTKKTDKAEEELKSKVKKLKKKYEKSDNKVQELTIDLSKLKGMLEDGDFETKNKGTDNTTEGKSLRTEMDDINKALKRMFVMMKQMRSDQMRALGTTKNALCLSCGRGEPNFPPPSDFVQGGNGNFYQGNSPGPKKGTGDFDYGKDVFSKEEVVKEHTILAHLHNDAELNIDVTDLHMGALLPKRPGNTRPQTSAPGVTRRTKSPVEKGQGAKAFSIKKNPLVIQSMNKQAEKVAKR